MYFSFFPATYLTSKAMNTLTCCGRVVHWCEWLALVLEIPPHEEGE